MAKINNFIRKIKNNERRSIVSRKLSRVPMGIPWEPIVNGVYAVGKAIYNHPEVQKKWKEVKKKHGLEWLPFGKKKIGNKRFMGKMNKMKYKKGTMMT